MANTTAERDKANKEWADKVAALTAALPTKDGYYIGDTYVWELDDGRWTPENAPYGMDGPEFDGTMKPYLSGDAHRVAKAVLEFAKNAGVDLEPDLLAEKFAEDYLNKNYL